MTTPTTKKLKLTLLRSLHGQLLKHRNNIRGLGLTRRHQSVQVDATPQALGMVRASAFMMKVEEIK
ncbi:MAG: 50S ribosomal protein L30 [Pseudomonadota bacterium]